MPPLGSNVGHRPSAQVLHRAMPATTRATPGRTNRKFIGSLMSQSQAVLDTRLAPLVAGTASESGADPSSFAEATDPAMPST
mmetsp:Transcript_3809/g.10956  ORF Transcript_3809/g.10956 Transcript_3809/m.10956 type:complete len:82 (-) Transcript_3809:409-654(-)